MNKMRFLTLSVILLLILNAISLFILFQTHMKQGGLHHEGKEGHANYIIHELKLDDQQQNRFAELRDKHHDMMRTIHEEDKALHDSYFSLLKTDKPDKVKVDSVSSLIGEQQRKMATTTFDHFRELRTICRDDQKKLFDNTIDEIVKMMGRHPME